MARVMPGVWMLTKSTLPSAENVGPVNSESFSMFRAIAYVGPPGVALSTWLLAWPSSARISEPHGVTVTLSGPSKLRSWYFDASEFAAAFSGK